MKAKAIEGQCAFNFEFAPEPPPEPPKPPERGWVLCKYGCIACRTAKAEGKTDGVRGWL